MFSLAYFRALGERAVTVFASTLGGLLTAGAFDLLNAPWEQSLAAAGMAALVSVLVSVGGGAATSSKAPAMTSKETQVELASTPTDQPYL